VIGKRRSFGCGLEKLRQPKIGNHRRGAKFLGIAGSATRLKKNIARLEVTVKNPAIMGILDTVRELSHQMRRQAEWNRCRPVLQPAGEVASATVGRHDVADAARFSNLEDWNYVGVVEPRRRAGLAQEALA
jgi:hypothetical protein